MKKINRKNNKQTYKTSNYNWVFFVFFLGVLGAGIFFYYHYYKPQLIRYKQFGIQFPIGNYLHGIDVSRYQQNIDWKEVEKMNVEGVQIKFAFIKATEGISIQDRKFKQNWENTKKTSIRRGAYHFFRANINPELQADFFLKTVTFEKGDLHPVIDIETTDGKNKIVIQERVQRFLNRIEEKLNTKPIIYTNVDFYKNYLSDEKFNEYPLWIAHYYEPIQPRTNRNWHFWQHSDRGNVNSIQEKVDFNVFNGTEKDLKKLTLQ
ncbi:MAG: glycoside hydrolase family 25 protein [Flavobacteriales bacterium]|nr:glycoside hydrolase family 25 protein [Flavobacteriales bacterium]